MKENLVVVPHPLKAPVFQRTIENMLCTPNHPRSLIVVRN